MESTRKALSFAIIFIFLDDVITNSVYEKIWPVDSYARENVSPCRLDADSVSITLYQYVSRPRNDYISRNDMRYVTNCDLNSMKIPVQVKEWTVFIIHGFVFEANISAYKDLAHSWHKFNRSNIFAVDWARSACVRGIRMDQLAGDPTIVPAAQLVAKYIARFITRLVREFKVSLKQITLVGHSLGAHIAGLTGKMLQNMKIGLIPSIYGLDPAAPAFEINARKYRLSYGDAGFVQIFHTSNVLGMRRAIGDDDFYFNGGTRQPSCDLFDDICNHNRAVTYLTEIFDDPTCQFVGALWNRTWVKPSTMPCKKFECSIAGPRASIYTAKGNLYVPVNQDAPYCVGGRFP